MANEVVKILEDVGKGIETGAIDIGKFVADIPKVIKAWKTLAPQVQAVAIQLLHDVGTLVPLLTEEGTDISTANFSDAIKITPQTWTAIKQLYADAKAGDEEIIASLGVLGIKV